MKAEVIAIAYAYVCTSVRTRFSDFRSSARSDVQSSTPPWSEPLLLLSSAIGSPRCEIHMYHPRSREDLGEIR